MCTFLRKHRHILIVAGIFCAVFLVFGAVRVFALPGLSLKTQTTKFNTVTDAFTPALQSGETVLQSIDTDRTLSAVAVLPDMQACKSGAVLTAQLHSASGTLLATATAAVPYTNAQEPPYVALRFPAPVTAPATAQGSTAAPLTLTLTVRPNAQGDSVRFYKSINVQSGMELLQVKGAPIGGSLTLLAETGSAAGFITPFFIVLTLLCAGALCAVYMAVFAFKCPLHTVTLVAVLCIGLLYMVVIPPYGATDERQHISQAYNNAARVLGIAPEKNWWGTTVRRASEHNSILEENETTIFSYQQAAQGLLSVTADPFNDATLYASEEIGGYQAPYILPTLGVLLGRFLHLGYVPTLCLGRLLNLAFFAAAAYWAVKLAPYGKSIFAAVCLLPVTLHVAASYSRDCFTLALAFVFTALCLRGAQRETPLRLPEGALLAALCILVAPAKSAYLPIILLLLLLPARRFAKAWHAHAYRGGVFALSLAGFWAANRFIVGNAAALGGAAPVAAGTVVNPDSIVYTVPYIVSHLRQTIALLVNSVVQHGEGYVGGIVGRTLGNDNLALSWVFVLAFFVLLLMAAQCGAAEHTLQKWRAAVPTWLALLGCCGCVVLGCVLWTPTHYTAIYGLQGRYFVPLLPLALLLLRPRRAVINEQSAGALVFALSAVQICTVLNAFYVVALR